MSTKKVLQVAFASEPSRNPKCSHTLNVNFDGASFGVVEEAILPADLMLSMLFIHSLDAILAIDLPQDVLQMTRKFRRGI